MEPVLSFLKSRASTLGRSLPKEVVFLEGLKSSSAIPYPLGILAKRPNLDPPILPLEKFLRPNFEIDSLLRCILLVRFSAAARRVKRA